MCWELVFLEETLFQCLQHTDPAEDLKHSLDGVKADFSADIFLFPGAHPIAKKPPFPPCFTLWQLFPSGLIPSFWSSGLQWHCTPSPGLETAGSTQHRVSASGLLAEAPQSSSERGGIWAGLSWWRQVRVAVGNGERSDFRGLVRVSRELREDE